MQIVKKETLQKLAALVISLDLCGQIKIYGKMPVVGLKIWTSCGIINVIGQMS